MAIFTLDLFRIVFEEFLRISPDLISKYSTIQDQLIYLFLIPHVILFLFIISFAAWVTGTHKGMRLLFSIITYVFIVWSGWYGTMIVPLFIFWFYGAIFIALSVFFIGRLFLHPTKANEFGELAKGIHKKLTEKSEKIKALEDEINDLTAQINSFGHGPHQPQQQQYIDYLTAQRAALQNKLNRLN